MGNQQILLIVLGMIIVGIAISIGIILVRENAVSSNRDAMTTDLMNIAARVEKYYNTTRFMGGGGRSYVGLTADAAGLRKIGTAELFVTGNGRYSIRTAGTETKVVLEGIGNVELPDGTFPIVSCEVSLGSAVITIEN